MSSTGSINKGQMAQFKVVEGELAMPVLVLEVHEHLSYTTYSVYHPDYSTFTAVAKELSPVDTDLIDWH